MAPTSFSDDQNVRHHAVAISVDALIQQWARQEMAPAGMAAIVDAEIAARLRGGHEWRHDDALAVGVLSRPAALEPTRADATWAAASLGAKNALDKLTVTPSQCSWPDRVNAPIDCDVAVSAVTSLGPGQVDFAALVVRVAPVAALGPRDQVATALIEELRSCGMALNDPDELLDRYRTTCGLLNKDVAVKLTPRGEVRGQAIAIDETYSLVVESRTGLRQTINTSSAAAVCELEDSSEAT